MLIRTAVSDPLPLFRSGVMAILGDAGLTVETPSDLREWMRGQGPRVVLLTLSAPTDWTLLTDLRRAGDHVLVLAMLENATVPSYLRALSAGAVGVLPRNVVPEVLRAAINAAVEGNALLPIEVLRALASRPEDTSAEASAKTLTEQE